MKLSALFPGLWDERGKEIRSTCSLKSQYQPGGYVPVQASDDGKSAMTSRGTAATPQWDGSLCRCFERSLLTGKRGQLPFLPRPWPEYYDTQYRLPTRQMGWPTLGCNQQDPRRASERLVNCKPAPMVPKVAGGASCKYGTSESTLLFFRLPLTANPCGAVFAAPHQFAANAPRRMCRYEHRPEGAGPW